MFGKQLAGSLAAALVVSTAIAFVTPLFIVAFVIGLPEAIIRRS